MNLINVAISSLNFLTFKEKCALSKSVNSLEELACMSLNDISCIIGRKIKNAEFNGSRLTEIVKNAVSFMEKQNILTLEYENPEFPALLKLIKDPPFMLYYRGSLKGFQKKSVSIVGTRKVCSESAKAAFDFAKAAAEDETFVISGLAFGIDSFAHKGALSSEKEACTAAVLPCGIDSIVPYSNRGIAAKILRTGGCILSEYIPGTPAEAFRFVQRNRIIAALSPAVVVMQAPPGSGALLTAEFALDYNRDLMLHNSCICKNAAAISESVYAEKQLSGKKIVNTIEKYLEEGAPLIDNYSEYVTAKCDVPGTHISRKNENLQLNLFD